MMKIYDQNNNEIEIIDNELNNLILTVFDEYTFKKVKSMFKGATEIMVKNVETKDILLVTVDDLIFEFSNA